MAVPSKPSYSVQPPSVVATDQTVTLAVYCDGATQLDVYVARAEYVEDLMWSGAFSPISSTAGLFSCPVPLASANLESGTQYVFFVQGRNSDGTSQSVPAYFVAVDRPIVTLTPADGSTITALPLVISWVVTDETGVSFQGLYVRDASTDAVLYYGTPSNFQRSVSLGMADLVGIEDGKSYEIDLRVGNGYGIITRVVHTITTAWAAPVTPTATVTTDPDTLAASVTVTAGAGTPLTDTLMVVRVNPDGTRHVLADDLESGDTVTDPLPPLGVEYTYEVTGIAATGVPSTAAIVPVTINTGAWALNFGEHAEECVLFRFNPSASYSIEHGGELYHFADGGANGGLPQWYGTTDRDESGSISWNTADRSLAMRLHDLSLAHPVGWIRDPYGRSWYARIVPSMSHERTRTLKVSINWDKVVWKEP